MDPMTPTADTGTTHAVAGEADLFQLDMQDFGPGYSYENAASLCLCYTCHCGGCQCGNCACIDYREAES